MLVADPYSIQTPWYLQLFIAEGAAKINSPVHETAPNTWKMRTSTVNRLPLHYLLWMLLCHYSRNDAAASRAEQQSIPTKLENEYAADSWRA